MHSEFHYERVFKIHTYFSKIQKLPLQKKISQNCSKSNFLVKSLALQHVIIAFTESQNKTLNEIRSPKYEESPRKIQKLSR